MPEFKLSKGIYIFMIGFFILYIGFLGDLFILSSFVVALGSHFTMDIQDRTYHGLWYALKVSHLKKKISICICGMDNQTW